MDVVNGAMSCLNIKGNIKREISEFFILRYPQSRLQEKLSEFL